MQNEGKSRGYWATPSEIQNRIKEREKNIKAEETKEQYDEEDRLKRLEL